MQVCSKILRGLAFLVVVALPSGQPAFAETGPAIPAKRFVLSIDTDLPGGDVATQRDTTLLACKRACSSSDICTNFTFNTRNGACFIKDKPGAAVPFSGAISGRMVRNDPQTVAASAERRDELTFLRKADFDAALDQSRGLALRHRGVDQNNPNLPLLAREAAGSGDLRGAVSLSGAAAAATDLPEVWLNFARYLLAAARDDRDPDALRERALNASINAWLRADQPGLRHNALIEMAFSLESLRRGAQMVAALRLAQLVQPRDDTAALLEEAIGKYGFRVLETDAQTETARPRICVSFSEELIRNGLDYTPYVQLPEAGLTVSSDSGRQLCIEGVSHGRRYQLTLREGLPAADGQKLTKSVQISSYVRDRAPGVRFAGRAYVLPRAGEPALPVVTVNTEDLDLEIFSVADRNILRSLQNGYLDAPISEYQESSFAGEISTRVWRGSARVAREVNRDVTTRLPLSGAMQNLPAGIYVLKASVPGTDPYEVPAAWQWFVVSDLGLTTLSGTDGLHVVVRSLGSAAAREGVRVELLSQANEILGIAQSDARGYARFEAGLMRGTGGKTPAMVVAKEGDSDIAFLSLTGPEFDLSDRGVEGREAAGPVDVFLITDRGAYRAGETVHATALTRDPQARAIPGLVLTAVWKRPDGVEYSRLAAPDIGQGGHVFALPLAGSAPRGVWRLEVYADPDAKPLASRTFLVEDFLPERIDFTTDITNEPLRPGDRLRISVSARYLFGAPAGDLPVEGEVSLRAAPGLPAFPGYSFGRHDRLFDARMESLARGSRTDAAGLAEVTAMLPLPEEDPGRPLEASFALRISEGSGRPVERRIGRILAPLAPMIGVKPLFDGVVGENSEARFEVIGVSRDETPEPMKLSWELSRIETQYQWYSNSGDWNWEQVTTRSRVAEGLLETSAGPAMVAAPVTWGEYEFVIRREDASPAETSVRFFAGWYAPADTSASPDMLEMSLDKPAYKPGDTARLRVVPRAPGEAIVTVLSDRVIALETESLVTGENVIELPVTDDWGAGVYVTVSALRPMDVPAGRNPSRALGLVHAASDPGPARLAVAIEAPVSADPRGRLDVALRVSGQTPQDPTWVTLAAVDEGILNLTGFKAPDPAGYYFGQRKLGVGIRDLYGRLIDGLNGATGEVRSGGDASAQARLLAPPPTEELLAWFSGPVQVGPDGLARLGFDLPAFNGSVRLMAVAWSGRGVGQARADVLVRDPVVVTASLPRFLAPGDESRLLLEFTHTSGPSGRMQLAVSGALSETTEIDLGEKQTRVLSLPLRAGQPGVQQIRVVLTTPDGRELVKVLSLPVQSGEPEVARISRFDLARGEVFHFDDAVFTGLMPGSGRATLAAGPMARLNVPGLLAALDRYPYGCTEQMTARAMPLLYFGQLAGVMELGGAQDIHRRVNEAITEILQNQNSEGAFGLWNAPQTSGQELWLDAWVTDFLSRARALGYAVPDIAFRSALDNLRNQVNYAADFDRGGEDLAYALLVLAREGAAAIGDLRYYADVKGAAFGTPLAQAQIGAALASYGDPERADAMFARAWARLEHPPENETRIWRTDFGSDLRDRAGVLTLAAEAGSQVPDREALLGRIVTDATLSTQESAWSLLAANALAQSVATEISFDGQAVTGPLVRMLQSGGAPVAVENHGDRTEVTLTTFGIPAEPLQSGGNGYAIRRSYYTPEGQEVSPATVKTGARLITVLEITPFDQSEARLMVNDPLPAGFEIDNPNLISSGAIQALAWLDLRSDDMHAEFRQDRFIAAVDQRDGAPFRLAYVVRAVSPGVFTHPSASVEDMYRPAFRAWSGTGQITIGE